MFFFQMKMADTAFEKRRDDEYVKYVLYIRPDDVNCDSVIRTVKPNAYGSSHFRDRHNVGR